ncbi:hypothetical protein [Actinoalloteichus caeruleus]|uniref:Secreted protein n=1 Tax=Actinoalloteichus caeruleus DSM 43889 TaxID=1120930 RepID=A0ABT1JCR0_ACTCY|nr:hypothetical protein [Actinoalloteichus caeruleus]MCP2330263.1 hypothetical protein [Actinoalloteichus caeruleus DSM 43889]
MIRTALRSLALLALLGSAGYYLWFGLTNQGDDDLPGMSWVGPQMVPLMIALPVTIMIFSFTGHGVMTALTGRNSAAFRRGQLGVGTVVGTSPTGATVNDQPELRIDLTVRTADGLQFASHARMVVPVTEVAALRPGAVVPVRYVPGRIDRVELDLSGDAARAQDVMNQIALQQGTLDPGRLEVAKRGTPAQGLVRALEVPGEIRDGQARLDITLLVTRPDGTTFETRVEKFVPPHMVAHVQVGRIVAVRYLPEDESRLVLSLPVNG